MRSTFTIEKYPSGHLLCCRRTMHSTILRVAPTAAGELGSTEDRPGGLRCADEVAAQGSVTTVTEVYLLDRDDADALEAAS